MDIMPDPMPSGGGCIRLVPTGPPRAHADTLILNRTAPCLRGMKVRLVTGTRFSRNIEWQVLLAATVWGTWVSLVFEDDVAARKSQ